MDRKERIQRTQKLMRPINKQIMMCDDPEDLIIFASAMLISSKTILNANLSKEESRKIIEKVFYND